ncbi:TIGR04222 domain-containing membrane protein [Streptomyces phaeolivaceus]|uniref:TIGR04222 domain-containing membrane protein n=1 Tax=Streptomyces phaeolivaceus TaxID=2653200 RepID=A0A5P8K4X5_9ACTN|nr:TIGR04222 domain-containing membrane protein [Streptomyces phaeolivaceus]QFQ97687.1 TIGR04222 domain-containing membrane protein [Streptomyces phaeolivaceus]
MRVFRRSAAVMGEPQTAALDLYDLAFLAGGAQRVSDSAVIALSETGSLRIRGSRVRAVGEARPAHPVEQAVLAWCPHSRTITSVHAALRASPEVEEIGRRLAARGLVTGARRRPTRAGKRQLQAAERDEGLPTYVFVGPTVLPNGQVRRGVLGAHPLPSGLGRALTRMGRALDRDSDFDADSDSHSDSGGGFSCGGGGGGGSD